MLADKMLVKWGPVKWVVFKMVALRLFPYRPNWMEFHTIRYGHEHFHSIHEYFFKWFAYICYWFESRKTLGLVLHEVWFFSYNQKSWDTFNLLIITKSHNTFCFIFQQFIVSDNTEFLLFEDLPLTIFQWTFIGISQIWFCSIVKFLIIGKFTEVLIKNN